MRPARAGLVTIVTPETEYTAGQTFEFTLEMPDVTDLFAYEVSLHLTSSSGIAGIDYYFVDASPASTNYLFASATNFADTTAIDSPSLARITISDIDDNLGTNVVSGINDQVANIRLMTASGFTDNLELSVDVGGLFLDDINLSSVAEFNSIFDATSSAGSTTISPSAVPEPSVSLIAIAGCIVLALRRSRRGPLTHARVT